MSTNEDDPRFPSGEWEGFYLYGFGMVPRHRMSCVLTFSRGQVSGSGLDDVGRFTWSGTYDVSAGRCRLHKRYATHVVVYDGYVEAQGMWGIWELSRSRGGFRLWPQGSKAQQEEEEQVELSLPTGEYEPGQQDPLP